MRTCYQIRKVLSIGFVLVGKQQTHGDVALSAVYSHPHPREKQLRLFINKTEDNTYKHSLKQRFEKY